MNLQTEQDIVMHVLEGTTHIVKETLLKKLGNSVRVSAMSKYRGLYKEERSNAKLSWSILSREDKEEVLDQFMVYE